MWDLTAVQKQTTEGERTFHQTLNGEPQSAFLCTKKKSRQIWQEPMLPNANILSDSLHKASAIK